MELLNHCASQEPSVVKTRKFQFEMWEETRRVFPGEDQRLDTQGLKTNQPNEDGTHVGAGFGGL